METSKVNCSFFPPLVIKKSLPWRSFISLNRYCIVCWVSFHITFPGRAVALRVIPDSPLSAVIYRFNDSHHFTEADLKLASSMGSSSDVSIRLPAHFNPGELGCAFTAPSPLCIHHPLSWPCVPRVKSTGGKWDQGVSPAPEQMVSVEDALASTTHQSYKFCRVWLREESNILQILIFFTIFSVCVYIYIFEPFLLKRKE